MASSQVHLLHTRVQRFNCKLGVGAEDRGALVARQPRPGWWVLGYLADYGVLNRKFSEDPVPTRVAMAYVLGLVQGWDLGTMAAAKGKAKAKAR